MPLPGALGAPRRLILDTAMSTIPLTTTGAELLRQELHRLKTVERPNATTAIAEARTHGDLSENAEYDAAKERQGFIEARIKEIEAKLSNAQVIDPKRVEADGRCVFGATVDLEETKAGESVTYQIVGDDEADIKSEEHTSELQSRLHLVCRLLLEKKKKKAINPTQYQFSDTFIESSPGQI